MGVTSTDWAGVAKKNKESNQPQYTTPQYETEGNTNVEERPPDYAQTSTTEPSGNTPNSIPPPASPPPPPEEPVTPPTISGMGNEAQYVAWAKLRDSLPPTVAGLLSAESQIKAMGLNIHRDEQGRVTGFLSDSSGRPIHKVLNSSGDPFNFSGWRYSGGWNEGLTGYRGGSTGDGNNIYSGAGMQSGSGSSVPGGVGWNSLIGGGSSSSSGGLGTNLDGKFDNLYDLLSGRAAQSLRVNPNDPIIRGQVEAFQNKQNRAQNTFLAEAAEQEGEFGNLNSERRLAAERSGMNTSAFQAELMGRELTARREEVAQALQLQAGMLTEEQRMSLQRYLGELDAAIAQMNLQQRAYEFDVTDEFRRSPLASGVM